ncbi:hypothetical protein GCM10027596_05910 [Nocardioides korecus]
MAEDRRKEPNLELPSLFGRKKKQKDETPPEAVPGSPAETTGPTPSVAATTSEAPSSPDTGRTPTRPAPRPATGRRRPPPPPPPGAGNASAAAAPAAAPTRRPPTPPPAAPTATPPVTRTDTPTASPAAGTTASTPPATPGAAAPAAAPAAETASTARAAAPAAEHGSRSPSAAPAAETEAPAVGSGTRGPDYEQPYDPRDADGRDRPVAAPAASAAAADHDQDHDQDQDGDGRRGRRLPWGRKHSGSDDDTTERPAAPAAVAPPSTRPAPDGPGTAAPVAAAAPGGARSAQDTDTLTAAPTTTLPAQGGDTDGAAEPRRRARRRPTIDPRVGAVVVGVVVGLIGVVLFYLAQVGCNAVRGVNSCGGLGVAALLLVAAVEVVVGSVLLKAMSLTETTSTSLLAVGMVAVIAMAVFFGALDSVWMFLVLPLLTGATFLASWWITHALVEDLDT